MLGCVLGDLYGSCYEGGSTATRALPEISERNSFTDDTVCTMAVIDHLLHGQDIREAFRQWVSRYPNAGYGRAFSSWARGIIPEPLSSWGNGALMRISPVALLAETLEDALVAAKRVTDATHAHAVPQVAVARYVHLQWMALQGSTRDELLAQWCKFGGELHTVQSMHDRGSPLRLRADETLEDVMSCLAESSDFDSLLANCLYHGGDSDTIAAVAGPLGELLWGISDYQVQVVRDNVDAPVLTMLEALYETVASRA